MSGNIQIRPDWLIRLRKANGLSQRNVAELVGVEQETVSNWECGRCSPYPSNLLRLADALGARPQDLAATGIGGFQTRGDDPLFLRADFEHAPSALASNCKFREAFRRIRLWDMQGCYSEAIREWEAFSRESGRRNPVVECFVKVKLANLYSHAGLQDRSLELLERLASPENRRKFGAHWWWACYHKAVTLRRSRRYHEARDLLQIVFAKWSQAAESTLGISALHQLGVVDLHERSCEAAVDKFEECVHGWGSDLYDGNYRKGFEYRRLGEAKLLAGRDRAAAREDLAKARQVFAWCHCKRYVEETIKDMEEMGM